MISPSTLLSVAAGGALGASLRFLLAEWARQSPSAGAFPWMTLGINVSGSLLLGVLAGGALLPDSAPPQLRAMVMVGVLGGFTTFSSFSLEVVSLYAAGARAQALLYVALSVVVSVGAAAVGVSLARGGAA